MMAEKVQMSTLQNSNEHEHNCNDSGYSGSSASFSQLTTDFDFRLANDRAVLRNRHDLDQSRRTIVMERPSIDDTFGFGLQVPSKTFEKSTPDGRGVVHMVDSVVPDSIATKAGLRIGDIIVGINGREVLGYSSSEVGKLLACCSLRLVLVFQNMKRIHDLETRLIEIRRELAMKERELAEIEQKENGATNSATNSTSSIFHPFSPQTLLAKLTLSSSPTDSRKSYWKVDTPTHEKAYEFDTFEFNRDCFNNIKKKSESQVSNEKKLLNMSELDSELAKLQTAFTHVIKLNPDKDEEDGETPMKKQHSHEDLVSKPVDDGAQETCNDSQVTRL